MQRFQQQIIYLQKELKNLWKLKGGWEKEKKQDKLLQEAVVDVSKLKVPQLVVSFSGCPRKFWARVQLPREDNFGSTKKYHMLVHVDFRIVVCKNFSPFWEKSRKKQLRS